jgi:hypothetical protein
MFLTTECDIFCGRDGGAKTELVVGVIVFCFHIGAKENICLSPLWTITPSLFAQTHRRIWL